VTIAFFCHFFHFFYDFECFFRRTEEKSKSAAHLKSISNKFFSIFFFSLFLNIPRPLGLPKNGPNLLSTRKIFSFFR